MYYFFQKNVPSPPKLLLNVIYSAYPLLIRHISPPNQVDGVSNLGDALVQANSKGFPADLLYSVAGLQGRSGNDKARLAEALESPKVQQDARKAAVEYAVKDLPTSRENTDGYCSYSWLRWLPFMDCETAANEVRQTI
ncbi:hypothetical protein QTP88_015012 [Uroleucon formosanum]